MGWFVEEILRSWSWTEHTHAHACSRHGDFEELILLFGCGGKEAGSERHDEFVELRGAGPYA